MDEGLAGGITPKRAAEQIIKGLQRNRREILVGSTELVMLSIRKYFPSLFFRLAGRLKTM
jgi:short-subunit dehydrogenase